MTNKIMQLADAYAYQASCRRLSGDNASEARVALQAEVDRVTRELRDANADLLLKCETIRLADAAIEEYRRDLADTEAVNKAVALEIVSLRAAMQAEVERVREENVANMNTCRGIITGLTAELEAAKANAARHRWMKAWGKCGGWTDEEIDRQIAIDIAVKGQP